MCIRYLSYAGDNQSLHCTGKVSFDKKILIKSEKETGHVRRLTRKALYEFVNTIYVYRIWSPRRKGPFGDYFVNCVISIKDNIVNSPFLFFCIITADDLVIY